MERTNAPVKKRSTQEPQVANKEENVIEYLNTTPAVNESLAQKISKQKIKERKQENNYKILNYRLNKPNGIVYILKTSDFTVYDEETNQRRAVRYCVNETSVFVDEQSEFSKREPVVFRNGELFVEHSYPALIKLLEIHPDNTKNGGNIFHLVQNEKTAEKVVEEEFAISDAIIAIREKEISDLYPVAMEFGVNLEQSNKEIKRDLIVIAKSQPHAFLRSLNSSATKLRAIVRQADEFGILRLDQTGAYWGDSNGLIVNNVLGKDIIETFSAFLTTEKGEPVLDKIKEELNAIS